MSARLTLTISCSLLAACVSPGGTTGYYAPATWNDVAVSDGVDTADGSAPLADG